MVAGSLALVAGAVVGGASLIVPTGETVFRPPARIDLDFVIRAWSFLSIAAGAAGKVDRPVGRFGSCEGGGIAHAIQLAFQAATCCWRKVWVDL